MVPRWYVNAVRELEDKLDNEQITQAEFMESMRELGRDLDEEETRHGEEQ